MNDMTQSNSIRMNIDGTKEHLVGGFIKDYSTNSRIFVDNVKVTEIKDGIGTLKVRILRFP